MELQEILMKIENLDEIEEKFVTILKELISIDTSVPPGRNYDTFIEILIPYLKKLGFSIEKVVVPKELVKEIPLPLEGERVNLVAYKDNGKEKDINFYAHMDVVPVERENWKYHPFTVTVRKSGKIYGRGTADMKGAIPCLILALQMIDKLNLEPKYNVKVLICTDEELGIHPGVKYLAENNYIKKDSEVFCMEGVQENFMPIGAAGAVDIKVETFGNSCHSGVNFLGINAIEESIPILSELMKLKATVQSRQSKDVLGIPRPDDPTRNMMSPMFNIDIIHGGYKSNIVPDKCTFIINRRYIPDEHYDDVIKEILDIIEKSKIQTALKDIKIDISNLYPPLKADPNSDIVKKMSKIISIVHKIPQEKIRNLGMAGSTDMGFVNQVSKNIIIRGVGNISSNAHGANESIRMKDVKAFIKEIILYLIS